MRLKRLLLSALLANKCVAPRWLKAAERRVPASPESQ